MKKIVLLLFVSLLVISATAQTNFRDINYKEALGDLKPALCAAFIKLFGFCAMFLPLAIYLGFQGEQLIAILVMLGSATTVSCFVMAKNMGHTGILTSTVVMLTTIFSGFSITMWLYILKALQLL